MFDRRNLLLQAHAVGTRSPHSWGSAGQRLGTAKRGAIAAQKFRQGPGQQESFDEWVASLADMFYEDRTPRRTIRTIYFAIDRLLSAGRFAACDALLQQLEAERLSPHAQLALLSITLPAKAMLPNRAHFADMVVRNLNGQERFEQTARRLQ